MSKADFERAYRVRDRRKDSATRGTWFSYGKKLYEISISDYQRRANFIRRHTYAGLNDKILIIGAGFGYLELALRDIGYRQITSLDNDKYIKTALYGQSEQRIRRNFIHADVLGDVSGLGSYDLVVSELLVSVIPKRKRPILYNNCDSLAPKTCHLTLATNAYNDLYDVHSLSYWLREYPKHIWVNLSTGEKLGGV